MRKLLIALFLLMSVTAVQAVPLLVNYQGMYVDNAGVPVTQTGVTVVTSIWDNPSSTNLTNRKYNEDHSVNIADGNFSIKIGSGANPVGTFNAALFDTASNLYLQLNINGEDMLPRVRFLSAPYTLQSENSAKLGNQPLAYFATASALTALQNNLGSEVTNRTGDVDTEEASRIAADTTLQNNINSEASARGTADTNLQSQITAANSARAAADTTLQTNINNEAGTRGTADTNLQNLITTANSTRASADTTLQNNINNEASTRTTTDTSLQNQITTEITNRTDADLANMQALCKASAGSVWVSSINLCVGGSINLTSTDLTGEALNGLTLYGATITKTKFTNANLSFASFRNIAYSTAAGNQPIFTSTNLTNATITGMQMTNINLATATLTNLYTNNLLSCPLTSALPANWSCVTYDGSLKRLIGPNARFYSVNGEVQPAGWSVIVFPANLTGVNFMYNQFHTCSFNNSSNFTNANFRGATFTSCNISPGGTVTWSNTICPDGSNTNTNGKGTCVGQGM